jgi:hypothetical protein
VELELRQLVGQPRPVAVEDVAVVVVFGENVARRLPRRLRQIGPVGDRVD